MINPQELRLGNWFSNGEKCYKLDASSLYDIATGLTDYLCEPIKLSPEIFGKCRQFKWCDNDWYEFKNKVHISVELHTGYIYFGKGEYLLKANVIYLHQIQNLIHDLTGTELEVNL